MATNEVKVFGKDGVSRPVTNMTVGEFKRMVAAIDDEHDWKDLWYCEVCGHHEFLCVQEDTERGVTIVGDRD